jgi:PEP-CTERM motif
MSCETRIVRGSAGRLLGAGAMVALALLIPVAAMADTLCQPASVCVTNNLGTLAGTTSGLTLTGSVVTEIGSFQGASLGSLTFSTGALLSGSLAGPAATFAGGAGSSFVIMENTSSFTGTLFSGTFSGPVNWTVTGDKLNSHGVVIGCMGGGCVYTLSGSLTGTWSNGITYDGATTQLTFSSKKPFSGSIPLSQGNTFVVTPEPGTLALMGTGFLAIGLIGKWTLKSKGNTNSGSWTL